MYADGYTDTHTPNVTKNLMKKDTTMVRCVVEHIVIVFYLTANCRNTTTKIITIIMIIILYTIKLRVVLSSSLNGAQRKKYITKNVKSKFRNSHTHGWLPNVFSLSWQFHYVCALPYSEVMPFYSISLRTRYGPNCVHRAQITINANKIHTRRV